MARSSPLFGPALLNLELLVCRRFPPPLATAEVGSGLDLLVVENSDTDWVAVEALCNHSIAHPIGFVAWGCGKSFPA